MVRGTLIALVIGGLLGLPTLALASRAPTHAEARSMAKVMGVPAKCLLQRVSTVNSRYAAEEFNLKLPLSSPCARYGSNGISILRREGTGWKSVYAFSSSSCARIPVPVAVKKDLGMPGCGTRRGGTKPSFWG